MKTISVFIAVLLMCAARSAFGQAHTQSISFDDGVGPGNAGTYSPSDHFSVDLYLTFSGYNCAGFDLWLETTANAAPHIVLTDFTYGTTFIDPTQPFAGPIGFTLLQSTGLYTTTHPSDLGATQNPPYDDTAVPPGTYFVGNLGISLSGLAPGVYVLRTDATSPRASLATSYAGGNNFADEYIPNSEYTITIVPEPTTLSLVALGILGIAAISHRSVRTRGG